jgi:hypothetical protein
MIHFNDCADNAAIKQRLQIIIASQAYGKAFSLLAIDKETAVVQLVEAFFAAAVMAHALQRPFPQEVETIWEQRINEIREIQ